MICAEIEKLEPKVPAATCTPLVEAGWEKLVAMCPKVAAPVKIADSTTPCCDKTCVLPLMKYFSTDAPHGFCGEACMDPKKFDIYHKFEANLTLATDDHPCSEQRTPDNAKHYTDYFSTVTHGIPGVLAVTLDLYAPKDMPDHSCCATPLFHGINCVGKPKSMTISGTGPFCCPSSATETTPCSKEEVAEVAAPQEVMAGCEVGGESLCSCSELISKKLIKSFDDCSQEAAMAACNAGQCKHSGEVEAQSPWGDFVTLADSTTPCCDKTCELPLVKYFSTDAPHGFCGEACMDPKKFNIYHKFEANLTRATSDHPCSEQYTPSNAKKYTDYFSTVTHGFPGVLTVTLDLYAPTKMVDHSCCSTPLLHGINCFGKPTSVSIEGTGPFCCPKGATETAPCAQSSTIVI